VDSRRRDLERLPGEVLPSVTPRPAIASKRHHVLHSARATTLARVLAATGALASIAVTASTTAATGPLEIARGHVGFGAGVGYTPLYAKEWLPGPKYYVAGSMFAQYRPPFPLGVSVTLHQQTSTFAGAAFLDLNIPLRRVELSAGIGIGFSVFTRAPSPVKGVGNHVEARVRLLQAITDHFDLGFEVGVLFENFDLQPNAGEGPAELGAVPFRLLGRLRL
jgi:hypothetical protein